MDSRFDGSDNEADMASNTNLESPLEKINSNIYNNDNDLFDDEVQYLPEYYLTTEANLDVGCLWQKYYSPKM
jgi:hypothetical protein